MLVVFGAIGIVGAVLAFGALLPFGWWAALLGASLGGSLLTLVAAWLLARRGPPTRIPDNRPPGPPAPRKGNDQGSGFPALLLRKWAMSLWTPVLA
jgi:hypothetical protein